MNRRKIILVFLLFISLTVFSQNSYQIAILKYNGGGDWYANPTSLPNLVEFCNKNINTNIKNEIATVEVGSEDIFNYPFLHMTGHGNVVFSANEAENLRNYLLSGGFLHIDDNYGMDASFRREMKRIFPEKEWVEIPFDHNIYHVFYDFPNGLPKVHEHDGKPPKGLGLFDGKRLITFYSYESDLGDGWEDIEVHNNPPEIREAALKMGLNIVWFALTQ